MSSQSLASQTGSGPIHQLVYRSVSLIGANSALQMSDILAEARPRNAASGITGVLTVVDGHFVQIVEGSASDLDDLVARLARDRRHRNLRILDRRDVAARAFGDWDMVSPRLAPAELNELMQLLGRDHTRLSDLIPVLSRAIRRQDAVLEGVETPPDRPAMSSLTPPQQHRPRGDSAV